MRNALVWHTRGLRRVVPFVIAGVIAVAMAAGDAHPAKAAGTITEFAVPTAASSPNGIAVGADGNIWFTEYTGDKIGRITPAGTITEFTVPTASAGPRQIAAGPDGNLWFTEFSAAKIGQITPSGTITEFSTGITASSGPRGITTGPDGNLWFTEYNASKIGRITPSGTVTEFSTGITASSGPRSIDPGPDGNLWFTENNASQIGRITTGGVVTEFNSGITANSQPARITSGPDGNLWFTENIGNNVGQITTSGTVTEFPITTSASAPVGIAPAADGTLWFAENAADKIGDITTAGTVAEYTVPTASGGPQDIVAGPDGNVWFTEQSGDKIGKITVGTSKLVLALDTGFVPKTLPVVAQGTALEWLFVGAETHSVVGSNGLGLLSSGTEHKGSAYTVTLNAAGAFKYKDGLNTAHTGTVSVALVASPKAGTTSTVFTITWAAVTAPSGYAYDVQVALPGAGFTSLMTGTSAPSTSFTPANGAGKYKFRARLRNTGNNAASGYSASVTITVT